MKGGGAEDASAMKIVSTLEGDVLAEMPSNWNTVSGPEATIPGSYSAESGV